jgi:hypothetical protein
MLREYYDLEEFEIRFHLSKAILKPFGKNKVNANGKIIECFKYDSLGHQKHQLKEEIIGGTARY